MKKVLCLLVVIFFLVGVTTSAHAHRRYGRGRGVSWETVAGIGIFAAIIGYIASKKSDIQEKGIDEEYRTQRYKIDADTTLAAPSALGDRESSEWDRPQEGRARIYSPLPVVRHIQRRPELEQRADDGPEPGEYASYAQKKSTVPVPDIADLESLYSSLGKYQATRREISALMYSIEEVQDTSEAMFSRRELRSDLDYLNSLQEKVLQKGAPVAEIAALEKLIKYIELAVFGKEIS